MKSWLAKLDASLARGRLLDGARRVLIAASGGPDSTLLVELLALWRASTAAQPPQPELVIGHVHHGLRGADADGDESFVRTLARRLQLPVLMVRGDARACARRWKLSPEAACRRLRYDAFAAWAHEEAIDTVALAHHRDDQAETVLLRAVRGSGWRGLAGMAPSRPLGLGTRARVIRPLLAWSRREIEAALEAVGGSCRADATNDDASVPRNWVRRDLLPALEARVHPGARKALVRLAASAAGLRADLEALGERAQLAARRLSRTGGVALSVESLRQWPASVAWEAVRSALAVLPDSAQAAWTGRASREVVDWVCGPVPRVEARAHLGGALEVDLRYGLVLLRQVSPPRARAPDEVVWPVPGSVIWGGWELVAELAGAAGGGGFELGADPLAATLDAERTQAGGLLRVRSRRDGDRLQPLGTQGRKKLKELFRELRVPPAERDGVPLVIAGGEIAWVVGHRIAEPFRVSPATRSLLRLRAVRSTG